MTLRLTLFSIFTICVIALASTLVAEHVFGLRPCALCHYQRYAYEGILGVALLGIFFKNARSQVSMILTSGLLFLLNSSIAFYQVLVEKKIVSLPGTCKAPPIATATQTFEQFKESLSKTGAHVPCDVVSFELFGLSMAGYNALFTLFCAIGCFVFVVHFNQSSSPKVHP